MEKIFAMIYRKKGKDKEFLLLRNNPADPKHGGDRWYVVTGGVETPESLENAVIREIQEETGILNILNIYNTNKYWDYFCKSENKTVKEYVFVVEIDDEVKRISEEHVDYMWVSEKDFVNKIFWYSDRKELNEIIKFCK